VVDQHPVVELRIHGVSGSPPAELLERAQVEPVRRRSGVDRRGPTGFHRPAPGEDPLDHNGDQRPQAFLEGYTWGGLTSGAPSRAFWLLLLPFALLNAAPRLRPPGGGGSTGAVWVLLALFRLLALTLTATFTVAAAGVGVDLLAWQCGGEPGRCTSLPPALALASWTPGHRLLLGLALPVLVLVLIYVLSRTTAIRYEQVDDGREPAPADGITAAPATPEDVDPDVAHPWLWRGDYMVRRQRSVHLQVGLLAVVVLLSGSLADAGGRQLVLAFTLATIAAGASLLVMPGLVGRRDRPPLWWLPRLLWLPTAVSIAFVLWPLALVPSAVRPDRGGALRSYDSMITWLFAVQLGLVVLVAAAVLVLRRRTAAEERRRHAMAGVGTVLVAALACLLGAIFSAGVYISAANLLTSGLLVPDLAGAPRGGPALLLPPSLQVTAVAAVAAAAVTLLAVAAALPRMRNGWRRSAANAELLAVYPDRAADPLPDRDLEIRKTFWRAGAVDRAPAVLTPLLAVLAAGAVGVTALVVAGRFDATAEVVVGAIAGAATLVSLGGYLIVGLLTLVTALAFAALRHRRTRRTVGILWDLTAFWPRSVHPMAPPCYAERTVPELLVRIREHTGATDDRYERGGYPVGALVLAAHSQGSVIAAATLLQLIGRRDDEQVVPRVALLTYGCVLRRLYSRYFPAYFGTGSLSALADRMTTTEPAATRWRNLWRLSDQLGGPVEFDPTTLAAVVAGNRRSDRLLIDPPYLAAAGTRPLGHSDFPLDPAFQREVGFLAGVLGELRPGPAPGRADHGGDTLVDA
jgi:hypothetical protein